MPMQTAVQRQPPACTYMDGHFALPFDSKSQAKDVFFLVFFFVIACFLGGFPYNSIGRLTFVKYNFFVEFMAFLYVPPGTL